MGPRYKYEAPKTVPAGGWSRLLALALAAALGLGAPAARAAETETGVAGAVILVPGDFSKIEDLRFGNIIAGASGGSITVANNGAVTTTGTVISMGGDIGAAEFELGWRSLFPQYAGPGAGDTIVLYNINSPSDTMTLRNFTNNYNILGYWFGQPYTFNVGGTLDVAANQEPGPYVGTFTVIINNY